MSPSPPIRLLIVDDHPLVIDGLRKAFGQDPRLTLVGTAADGHAALEFCQENEVDLAILDLSLPGMDGMELCKLLRKAYPLLKIIGLTTYDQVSFITEMLRNGANGYLFKNVSQEELLQAIHAVMEGETYLSKEVHQKLLAKAMQQKPTYTGFIPRLSRREKEVLKLIVDEHTNQEIADKLCIALTTVETHRVHLREKLGARNTAGMVRMAIKFGLA